MADPSQPSLDLVESPTPRRRGRPRGARNKRSIDLARWVEATMGGQTPGQQCAQLAMVSPKELRDAPTRARDLGIAGAGLDRLTLAMVVKAELLARALGVERAQAWAMLLRERSELMPYIHQRQAPMAEAKGGKSPATVFLIPEGEAQVALADFTPDDDGEHVEIIDDLSSAAAPVSRG